MIFNIKIYLILSLFCNFVFIIHIIKFNQKQNFLYKTQNLNNQNQNEDLYFNLLATKIKEIYKKNDFVNINEIESKINKSRPWKKHINRNNEINLGFHIDKKYVLRSMVTLTSIMDSQNKNTSIRFHIAVVDVDIQKMLKIYTLRNKIREDVEFNFYNAKRVVTDLQGLNTKGPGLNAKLIIPQLLPDDVKRIFILDTGDLLVLKDLTEVYNWNMSDCLYAGVPAAGVGKLAKISNKTFNIYICCGSFLVDVKKVKEEEIYEKFIKYKNSYSSTIGDQDLLNDIAFGKITYLPFKYGMISPFLNDKDSEIARRDNMYSFYMSLIKSHDIFKFLPKNETEFLRIGYSPYIIHHMHAKWMDGEGLTVYRKLAQYFIRYAGIWDEICKEFPGYCK